MCVRCVLHEVINIIIVGCISALAIISSAYGDYDDDGHTQCILLAMPESLLHVDDDWSQMGNEAAQVYNVE